MVNKDKKECLNKRKYLTNGKKYDTPVDDTEEIEVCLPFGRLTESQMKAIEELDMLEDDDLYCDPIFKHEDPFEGNW